MEAESAKATTANFHGLCCWLIGSKLKKGAVAMHGYGMVGDLLHLALYLASIGFWSLLWMVCIFSAKGRLRKIMGTHALLICLLLFPLLPATFIGGALIAFGIEGIAWICGIVGIGLPLAGLGLIKRYLQASPNGHA